MERKDPYYEYLVAIDNITHRHAMGFLNGRDCIAQKKRAKDHFKARKALECS